MVKVEKIDKRTWKDYIEACLNTTFFHTPMWYEVWEDYNDYRCEARMFRFESGKTALLPLASKPMLKGLSSAYHSSPAGTYGGYLSKDSLSLQEQTWLADYLKNFPMLTLRVNPFARKNIDWEVLNQPDFTQVLKLDRAGEVTDPWSPNHLWSLGKARKQGFTVRVANSLGEWQAYFEAYQECIKRWGGKPKDYYPWALFDRLYQIPEKYSKLWVVLDKEQQVISGYLCFYYKKHVVEWHGASRTAFLKQQPTHLLHYEVLKHARAQGYDYYDFNPSGGFEGVVKYKKAFGAERISAPVYHRQSKSIKFAYQIIDQIKKLC